MSETEKLYRAKGTIEDVPVYGPMASTPEAACEAADAVGIEPEAVEEAVLIWHLVTTPGAVA